MAIKVSVITVVKDCADQIESTLNSVLEQNYKDIEYIVLDGGSVDGTWEIIQQYTGSIDKLVRREDKGVYYGMNAALDMVEGEWVAFMNAGDEYVSNSTVRDVFDQVDNAVDLVYGDVYVSDGANDKYIRADLDGKIFRETPFCHQSLFVKADLMKARGFNTFYRILADYDFVLDCYLSGRLFQYVQMPVSRYRLGGYSFNNRFLMYLEGVNILIGYSARRGIDYKESNYYIGLERIICQERVVRRYWLPRVLKVRVLGVVRDVINSGIKLFRH